MRNYFKSILPKKIVKFIKSIKNKNISLSDPLFLEEIDKINSNKSNKEIFYEIYETSAWNSLEYNSDNKIEYNSGPGSHDINIIGSYIDSIIIFLKSFKKKQTVVDLGCGDFNIGKNFAKFTNQYIACDVAENVIKRHSSQSKFKQLKNLEFKLLDITNDRIPNCNIIIIRQVLQHLSNYSINLFLKNIQKTSFQYLVVTEYIPSIKFTPNIDQPTGTFSRLARGINSGVVLTEKPFNLNPIETKIINKVVDQHGGVLETIIYKLS